MIVLPMMVIAEIVMLVLADLRGKGKAGHGSIDGHRSGPFLRIDPFLIVGNPFLTEMIARSDACLYFRRK